MNSQTAWSYIIDVLHIWLMETRVIVSGLEKEPKLSAALVPVLHKFAVTQKLSPVKVTNVLYCSFTFGKIWPSMCLTSLRSCRPKVISPEVMSHVGYSKVTCHLTTKLFPAKCLWRGQQWLAKSFLLVVCKTRCLILSFPPVSMAF